MTTLSGHVMMQMHQTVVAPGGGGSGGSDDPAETMRHGDRLQLGMHVQLGEDRLDLVAHGGHRHEVPLGDLDRA